MSTWQRALQVILVLPKRREPPVLVEFCSCSMFVFYRWWQYLGPSSLPPHSCLVEWRFSSCQLLAFVLDPVALSVYQRMASSVQLLPRWTVWFGFITYTNAFGELKLSNLFIFLIFMFFPSLTFILFSGT